MVSKSLQHADMQVQLITKPASPRSGIGRYAVEIEAGLQGCGIDVVRADLKTLRTPILSGAAKRLGYDLETFSRSYPVRARVVPGRITHLTSQTLATLLVTQRLPRPVIVTVHDILPYVLRNDSELTVYRNRVDRTMDALAMRGLKRADRLIADSGYTRQTLIDTLHIPGERIDVVHLGVDSETFRPRAVPPDFYVRHGLDSRNRYVLFVGSEDPRKDLVTLLEAIAIVRRNTPDIHLVKVGAPAFTEQRERNVKRCQDLGIADAVHWIDEVSEEELPLFYCAATVFAFPSRFEGFGFPVLEAIACGTPVAAADASSVPELVSGVATLVPPRDPLALAEALIRTLSDNSIDRERLISHASRFRWTSTVKCVLKSYESAMSAVTH